jgi:hypothetical protein
MSVSITLTIPGDRIAQLFASAIEGGDPVTSAARGGWCEGIELEGGCPRPMPAFWYTSAELYDVDDFEIIIHELDDENTGHVTVHKIRLADIVRGLEAMAAKYPGAFSAILDDDLDTACADTFLQCMLFGEEKYA